MKYFIAGLLTVYLNISFANTYIEHYVFYHLSHKNLNDIKNYLWKSAESKISDDDASYILGILYLGEYGFPRNLKLAKYFLEKSASMKNPRAIHSVGDGYYSGDTHPKNLKKALEYYENAGKLGYGPSQFNAGIIYMKYIKNNIKAMYWFKKAFNNKNLDNSIRQKIKDYIDEINR